MHDHNIDQVTDRPSPASSVEEVRAALARSKADMAAGRTVSGASLLAEMEAKLERYHAKKRTHGETDR